MRMRARRSNVKARCYHSAATDGSASAVSTGKRQLFGSCAAARYTNEPLPLRRERKTYYVDIGDICLSMQILKTPEEIALTGGPYELRRTIGPDALAMPNVVSTTRPPAPVCAPTADNIEGPFYKAGAPHRAPRAPG